MNAKYIILNCFVFCYSFTIDMSPLKQQKAKHKIYLNNHLLISDIFLYLQFSFQDNVQDMRQVVLDRSESCYKTCFSLWLDGVRLDDFAELHMIEGLKENSLVKVIEGMHAVIILSESIVAVDV